MKIELFFKTPDAVNNALSNLDRYQCPYCYKELPSLRTMCCGETHAGCHDNDDLKEQLEKWISYGEYVTVEFDSEKDTMTVLKN